MGMYIERKCISFEWLHCFTSFLPYIADGPAALVSSDNGSEPIEASIEDLHDIQDQPDFFQTDARVGNSPLALDEKLHRELQYHKHGSYNCENQSDATNGYQFTSSNPFLQNHVGTSDHTVRQPEQDRPHNVSSVHSWTKVDQLLPTSQEDTYYRPTAGFYDSMNSSIPSPFPISASNPSLSQFNQQHPHSHYDRQQSWPAYPVSDTAAPEMTPGCLLSSAKGGSLQDTGKR